MRNPPFSRLEAGPSVGKAPHQETALFLAAVTFGLAMLSLLAVLALVGVVELTHLLPFFAVPLLLFIGSASVVRRWVKGEAEEGAIDRIAHGAPRRVNDIGDVETMAHLLEFDSVLGRLNEKVDADSQTITIGERRLRARSIAGPENLRARLGPSDEEWARLEEAESVVDASFEFAQAGTDPDRRDALKNVYAEQR
jgi:hypothetical protein